VGSLGSGVDKPRQYALEAHQVERALGKGEVQGSNPCGGSCETVRMQGPVCGSPLRPRREPEEQRSVLQTACGRRQSRALVRYA
jgi:hypothetical protein